ncbi:MAG: ATP phosphoribosyltransferase [Pseudomonadota bacterium]
MTAQRLILGLPSKGRLMDDCLAYFAHAGLTVRRSAGGRNYGGEIKEMPDVDVRFLSAGEIASLLAEGAIHLGVTGLDLVHEKVVHPQNRVLMVDALGFGHADVVVAVPQSWIDVSAMDDLEDITLAHRRRRAQALRVATKYFNLTREFFARHGITDYRIVESAGATEGAPASGGAEIIVDITSTGATLAANKLKVLADGVIMRSEAHLTASLAAPWGDTPLEQVAEIFDRIAGRAEARGMREVRARLPAGTGDKLTGLLGYAGAVLIAAPTETATAYHVIHCPEATTYRLTVALRAAGADRVTVKWPDFVFVAGNERLDRLQGRLANI